MKFTLGWLKQHLDTEASVEEIAEAMRGLRALGLALLVEQTGGMALGVAERLHLIRGGRLASEKAVDDGAGIDEPRDF